MVGTFSVDQLVCARGWHGREWIRADGPMCARGWHALRWWGMGLMAGVCQGVAWTTVVGGRG